MISPASRLRAPRRVSAIAWPGLRSGLRMVLLLTDSTVPSAVRPFTEVTSAIKKSSEKQIPRAIRAILHLIGMVTGNPGIQAAVSCTEVGPWVRPGGIVKSTLYESMVPGHPI